MGRGIIEVQGIDFDASTLGVGLVVESLVVSSSSLMGMDGAEVERRSVLLKGSAKPEFVAAALVLKEATDFLTASAAAEPVADAFEFRVLAAALKFGVGLEGVCLACGMEFAQLWSAGKRWAGQNCSRHLTHRMGEKRTFLHVPLAHLGVAFDFCCFPLITEHS